MKELNLQLSQSYRKSYHRFSSIFQYSKHKQNMKSEGAWKRSNTRAAPAIFGLLHHKQWCYQLCIYATKTIPFYKGELNLPNYKISYKFYVWHGWKMLHTDAWQQEGQITPTEFY